MRRYYNGLKTAVLLGLLTGLILTVGYGLGGSTGLLVATVLSLAMNGVAYFASDRIALAEVDQPVQPCHSAAGQDRGAQGGPGAGPCFGGGTVVAVRGRQRPRDGADDQHQHRDDEHEGQQRTDDLAQITDAFQAVEVGKHIHAGQLNRR